MQKINHILKNILFFGGIAACFWASGATTANGFDQIFDGSKYHTPSISTVDGYAIRNVLIQLFKNGALMLFILALVVAFVSVIRLLTSQNNEEDFTAWMTTLLWSVAGLFIISISYTVIRQFESRVFVTQSFSGQTVYEVVINIIYPILNFIRYMAAICFFLAAIYAFYRIVTSMGDEERAVDGRKVFMGSVFGFIVMMLAEPIVRIVYGGGKCGGRSIFWVSTDCTQRVFDVAGSFGIIAKIIVFLNGFIALITIVMIMYAGFLILTWSGDEERTDKAKRTITYAVIGVVILIFSYVIYRFMILQS